MPYFSVFSFDNGTSYDDNLFSFEVFGGERYNRKFR